MDIPPPPDLGGRPPQQYGQGPYGPPPQTPYPGGPQVPYQRWPGAYSPYSRPPVNGFAIASLVLGILCFVPAVGLILGLIALAQITKKGERGKGMAIAGSILSVVGIVLLVLAVVTGGARDFADGFKEAARESRNSSAFPIDKGECFNVPDSDLQGARYTFEIDEVPCSSRHDGEVLASVRVNHETFPGDAALTSLAERKCVDLDASYVLDSWVDLGDAELTYYMPDRETWSQGDRHITCLYGDTGGKRGLKGSFRRDATNLDADQLAYLQADKALSEAYESEPVEDSIEEDLKGHKAWAGRVDKGLAEQARLLRAHDWPAKADADVTALIGAIERNREQWAKASTAKDADAFYEYYVPAQKHISGKAEAAARKPLGLATTSPRDANPGG
ncbi:DUF4190 domain-containing protein [Streptomyces sp. MZ04]|uniref:DUF4190 domain-containing protein n=1 Tax=Streptomyces sp. MZ04 TaxID=2559236 RepID=UPI00107EC7B2|nr:DUF4190 domain-containing protein [Streptomyces sp. MZ04]TGA95675.1 DUF4190 domain-containing protein [Streptomyces sp. MZ04]